MAAISEMVDGDCGADERRAAFCRGMGVDAGQLVCGRQVHGMVVAVAREEDRGRRLPATDGLVTDVPGLPMAISVADCVPVYLFDPHRRAIGLVHAGREGTRLDIAASAIHAMCTKLGCRADDIHAVIGPSAGPCCYEVSEPMAEDFCALGLPVSGRHLDLWESNARQLSRAGVPRSQIEAASLCTICGNRFFSHRRDSDGKRNMALLSL